MIPIDAVLGIYARETGQGMIFGEDDSPEPQPPVQGGTAPPAAGGERRPKLKVVK